MSQSTRLLIFKVNQVGDAMCFLPVLQQLLRSPFLEEIHLWTTPSAKAILACHPKIKIHEMALADFNQAWKNPLKLWHILKRSRTIQAHACLLDFDQGNVAHLAAHCAQSSLILGGTNPDVRLNRYLRHRASIPTNSMTPQWCWEIGRTFAKKFWHETWPEQPPQPDLTHLLNQAQTQQLPAQTITLHPGASRPYQRWPLERYLQLAQNLAQDYPVKLIQPLELAPIAEQVNVEILRPKSLPELAQILAQSSVFIGNNSGPMNFCYALGTPSVVFWGPSSANWGPQWHKERHLILKRSELACIECDSRYRDSLCHNSSEPMACMQRWQTHEVTLQCLQWIKHWTASSSH